MNVFSTTGGPVRGRRPAPEVVAVLGIPYAAPPFGANRFREPRPARTWAGVRDCAGFGPIAPQSARLPGAPYWSPGDEDILTLNVWTLQGAGGLPVLVWIHGGAYTFGSSAQPDFDGVALARAGLVVVTLNYRLGFEGFGHIPADGSTRGAAHAFPDNRGLLDQIAALRWVADNIAGFGGDPANVTVAGQSSGAASVACLMGTGRARGLFRRAIAHSAVGPCYSAELAAGTTGRVAAAAGVPATAAGLLSASPYDLVTASDQVADDYRRDPASGFRHYNPVLYGPVAEGDVLPADPLATVATGVAREVDLLVCHTTQEYWLMDAVGSTAKVSTDAQLASFAEDFGLPGTVLAGYRALMPDAPAHDLHLAILGDLLFSEYSTRLAEQHARAGGRAFLSRFVRQRTGAGGEVRAWHCADIPFAFGNLADENVHFLLGGPPTESDHELSHRMMSAWAAFAATGDPGWQPLGPDGPKGTADTADFADPAALTDSDALDDAPDPTPVRVWGTAETLPSVDVRPLWRAAGFPPLRP
ncbi:carboxylesterase family protein [Streptomyces sp. 21So2-11]|uniref:carboxylesterase/lipase family protein n=1 Tax=Streptomyces sp. 21So2-11 TaxID=3144408 RepID=UPI003218EB1A